MEQLTPHQQLDIVLNYLKQINKTIEFNDLNAIMKEKGVINKSPQLYALLEELESDKYISILSKEKKGYEEFIITPKGKSFIGYVALNAQVADAEAKAVVENELARELDIAQRADTSNMVWLTRWIALAAIPAALYYIYYLWQEVCWCEFSWQHHR